MGSGVNRAQGGERTDLRHERRCYRQGRQMFRAELGGSEERSFISGLGCAGFRLVGRRGRGERCDKRTKDAQDREPTPEHTRPRRWLPAHAHGRLPCCRPLDATGAMEVPRFDRQDDHCRVWLKSSGGTKLMFLKPACWQMSITSTTAAHFNLPSAWILMFSLFSTFSCRRFNSSLSLSSESTCWLPASSCK